MIAFSVEWWGGKDDRLKRQEVGSEDNDYLKTSWGSWGGRPQLKKGYGIQGGFSQEFFDACSHADKNESVTRGVLMMQDRERG